MKHIKGPDFPTGGMILGPPGHPRRLRDRPRPRHASARRPTSSRSSGGKEAIIVTELPFMVKKGGDGGLITKIADLVRDKKITEISDLRDESDRIGHAPGDRAQARRDPEGRAQQALQAHADADDVRRQHGRARRRRAADALACSEMIHALRRATSARSSPAAPSTSCAAPRRRAHILEGLLIALDNLDAVIDADPRLGRPRRRPRAA